MLRPDQPTLLVYCVMQNDDYLIVLRNQAVENTKEPLDEADVSRHRARPQPLRRAGALTAFSDNRQKTGVI
jgi:hypothetical protein